MVGNEAREFLLTDPARTIYSVKRLLGKSYRDLGAQAGQLGYKVIDDNTEGLVKIRVEDRFYSPIELSADILRELRANGFGTFGATAGNDYLQRYILDFHPTTPAAPK